MMSRLQMIRLTQPEVVHDKKQQSASSPDENTVKKEADAGTVPRRTLANFVDSVLSIHQSCLYGRVARRKQMFKESHRASCLKCSTS